MISFFFIRKGHPPRSTLFPYTTLSRSAHGRGHGAEQPPCLRPRPRGRTGPGGARGRGGGGPVRGSRRVDRKSTRLNSSHANNSYAVFCLKKKKNNSISFICTIKTSYYL